MRLLQLQGAGSFSLVEFQGNNVPPYAILSHTWGTSNDEVTYQDLLNSTGKGKSGYRKLTFCGQRAAEDGLQHFWIDTCCINKDSSSELSEAIISMFRWYKGAAKCYVYLSDVSISNFAINTRSFQESRWFKRGWTLQELLAPTSVEFFSQEHSRLGDKNSLMPPIAEVTGIPLDALRGSSLSQFSIKARVSWLGERQTKREEDRAYCLLGILDVQMVPLYGEGQRMAFERLLGELSKVLQIRSLAQAQRTLFVEPTKRNYDLSSTMPYSRYSDFVERSDIAGVQSANVNTSDFDGASKNFRVATRTAASRFEDNTLRGRVRKAYDSKFEVRGSGLVSQSFSSYTHDPIDANELTSLQLRNNFKFHNEALINKTNLIEKHTTNENERSLLKPMTGRLAGTSMRVNTIDFTTDLVLQLTQLEEYIQGEFLLYSFSTKHG
jgi:hypothetical protein